MSSSAGGILAGRERLIRASGAILATLSLCAAVYGALALLGQNFADIALAHLFAATTGGAAGNIADRRRLGWHFFPWIVAFTCPLLGGVAAYLLLQNMKKPRAGKLIEEYSAYLDEAASFRESVPYAQGLTPAEPLSLGDVLNITDSEAEQRIAIEYLSEMETPSALEILRKAASTAGSEAYFFSMTALTQMEDRMLARLDELEYSIQRTGEVEADADLLMETARSYLDFIYYNFASGEIRTEYLRRIDTLLSHVFSKNATGKNEIDEALILSGRVRLAMNESKAAARYFTRYIESNPEKYNGYLWRAEAWYKLHEYSHLREDCASADKIGGIPQNMRSVVDFWLEEGTDSTMWAAHGQSGSA